VEVLTLEALVIDIKGEAEEIHHVKVGLAIELTKKIPEEELKSYVPRARHAAIGYLRGLTYAEAASPKHFDTLRSELGEAVAKAVGKSNVSKVLFTDFVVQ
jgi:flagellar basal body-associated protein FliL